MGGTDLQAEKNSAYIAKAVDALAESLRNMMKTGRYGRIIIEAVVQDGVIQNVEATVKKQLRL